MTPHQMQFAEYQQELAARGQFYDYQGAHQPAAAPPAIENDPEYEEQDEEDQGDDDEVAESAEDEPPKRGKGKGKRKITQGT